MNWSLAQAKLKCECLLPVESSVSRRQGEGTNLASSRKHVAQVQVKERERERNNRNVRLRRHRGKWFTRVAMATVRYIEQSIELAFLQLPP